MVREDVETVIDRLEDYVKRAGKCSLGDAANAMGRPANQIERLALLLEEKNILEVHYDITGVKLAAPKLEEDKLPAAASEEEKQGEGEKAAELEREVMASESLMNFFEKDLERRLLVAEKMVDALSKNPVFTKQELEKAQKEVDVALKQLEAFDKEISIVASRKESFRKKLEEFRKKLFSIKPLAPQQAAELARAAIPTGLPRPLAALLRELLAFLNFIKQDLQKILAGKPQAQPLHQAGKEEKERQPAKEGRQRLPPVAASATASGKHTYELHPVKPSQENRSKQPIPEPKQFFSLPIFGPRPKKGTHGEPQQGQEHGEHHPHARAEEKLAEGVSSLAKGVRALANIAKKVSPARGYKTAKTAEKGAKPPAKKTLKKSVGKKGSEKTFSKKPVAKKIAGRKKRARRSRRGWKRVRVAETRRDGRKQHYWKWIKTRARH